MHIKISEKNGTWNLWATEGGTNAEPPIYTASCRSRDQIVNLLRGILDETPPAIEKIEPGIRGTAYMSGAREALRSMLESLDGWVEGAKSNHGAMEHRGESRGEECWRNFAPGDIRNMVNDAAREMGIAAFSYPTLTPEDRP